jgi:polysaccharide export outer membrane protein
MRCSLFHTIFRACTAAACALIMMMVAASAFAQAGNEVLGEGDTVRVTVFQNPDLTTEGRVSSGGAFSFPLIGEVKIGGLSPTRAASRIADQLKSGNFLRNPQVTVSVLQLRSRQVSVLGHVARPGRYPLDDTSSKLTDVLALAGGIAPTGDDTVLVVVNRNGKAGKMAVDVPVMFRKGDLSKNVEVQNGDTIFVQRAPVFYIYGEVQRAGAYRLEPNMSVMQALSLGGGVTPRGTDRGLKINRMSNEGAVKTIDARLTDLVQADDVIFIRESLF